MQSTPFDGRPNPQPSKTGVGSLNRNLIVDNPDAVHTKVRTDVSHGGEEGMKQMVLALLKTGHFDDVIDTYMDQRDRSAVPLANVSFEAVTNLGDMEELRRKDKEKRQRAEKQRTNEDIDNDADIGAIVEETDDFA